MVCVKSRNKIIFLPIYSWYIVCIRKHKKIVLTTAQRFANVCYLADINTIVTTNISDQYFHTCSLINRHLSPVDENMSNETKIYGVGLTSMLWLHKHNSKHKKVL